MLSQKNLRKISKMRFFLMNERELRISCGVILLPLPPTQTVQRCFVSYKQIASHESPTKWFSSTHLKRKITVNAITQRHLYSEIIIIYRHLPCFLRELQSTGGAGNGLPPGAASLNVAQEPAKKKNIKTILITCKRPQLYSYKRLNGMLIDNNVRQVRCQR